MWDLLPVLRWFGARKKIVAAVGRRDAFLRRLIDAERNSLDDGGENDKKSVISFRSALPAEVGAGGVHGYRNHGSLLLVHLLIFTFFTKKKFHLPQRLGDWCSGVGYIRT
jgi:hypothetical protein